MHPQRRPGAKCGQLQPGSSSSEESSSQVKHSTTSAGDCTLHRAIPRALVRRPDRLEGKRSHRRLAAGSTDRRRT
eukprot:1694775-Prymnesium_polylepis.2